MPLQNKFEDVSNTMRFIVASDIHVGYAEKDPVRTSDSINAFEEILSTARDLKVDFILLGGDLFHENKPTRSCLFKVIELIKKHTLGDTPTKLESVKNDGKRLHFLKNLNISIPILTIHGNHDDPSGDDNLCVVDLLEACGLVTHFGKITNMEEITVDPILLKKGNTRLSLYGMGSVRDERLYQLYRMNKVKVRPTKGENIEDHFHLMTVHQNRVNHSQTAYLDESMLPSFIDLVVWGHEHECLIEPQINEQMGFYVSQPGSTVATALSEGESKRKCIGLIEINGTDFKFKKIVLKSVRPFIFDNINVNESMLNNVVLSKQLEQTLTTKIEEMICLGMQEWASRNQTASHVECNILPLIRLRLNQCPKNISDYINIVRFGQKFQDRVANPRDILLITKRRETNEGNPKISINEKKYIENAKTEDVIDILCKDKTLSLSVLTEQRFNDALRLFTEKDNKDALKQFVDKQIDYMYEQVVSQLDLSKIETAQDPAQTIINKLAICSKKSRKECIEYYGGSNSQKEHHNSMENHKPYENFRDESVTGESQVKKQKTKL